MRSAYLLKPRDKCEFCGEVIPGGLGIKNLGPRESKEAAIQAVRHHLHTCVPYNTYGLEPVDTWFEISHAQYMTVPRVIMTEMPYEWQMKMVKLLEEMDERYDWRPNPGTRYYVHLMEEPPQTEFGTPEGYEVEEIPGALPDPLAHYRRPDYAYLASLRKQRQIPCPSECENGYKKHWDPDYKPYYGPDDIVPVRDFEMEWCATCRGMGFIFEGEEEEARARMYGE